MRIPLQRLAHVRSGDKGNTSNVSVIAYEPALFPILKEQLTSKSFKEHYGEAITGAVQRFEIENLCALNFVCQGALGGGVSRSLSIDNYGKALSAVVLSFECEVPDKLASLLR